MTERRGDPGPIVDRALETLRELPAIDSVVVARIVAAAARTRALDAAPNDDDLLPPPAQLRPTRWRLAAAAAAIVITIGGMLLWRAQRRADGDLASSGNAPVSTPYVPATQARTMTPDAVPVPTQFVFDGRARHVVLVGDFNNWDEHATPLEREPGSSLWSVTVPIQRGRHIYAFLVDSVWTVDKRAPVARDPDFGVTGSVILVGRP